MLIYVDLETTGLDPAKHRLAQLAALTEDGAKEFETKVRFVEALAEPAALALGWYDRDAWGKEAVEEPEALRRLDAWLAEVCPTLWSRKLVAHNAEFDKGFLTAAYKRVGRKYPADYRMRCTMQLAMWLLPYRKSYKLADLARDLCQTEVRKEKGAPEDVKATRAVVEALKARFGRRSEEDRNVWQIVRPAPSDVDEIGAESEATP